MGDAPAIELQSREAFGLFRIEFQSSDQFSTEYSHEYEFLPGRFAIAPGVIVPACGYTYSTSRVSYSLGQQRKVSGRLSASTGTLYGGTKSDVSYSGRWGVVPQFSLEPSVTLRCRRNQVPGERPRKAASKGLTKSSKVT